MKHLSTSPVPLARSLICNLPDIALCIYININTKCFYVKMDHTYLEKCNGEGLWKSCLFGAKRRRGYPGARGTSINRMPRMPEMGQRMPTEMGEQEAPWRWTSRRPRAEGWALRPVRAASSRPREVLAGHSENNDNDKTFP